jgi:2-polyprenyl-3-methyl-5-hydroxy-6-metoxy-1,4-benzoquinol methylase
MDPRSDADVQRALPLSGWRRRVLEPLARTQRAFNDAVLKVTDALSERIDGLVGALAAGDRRVRELEERLTRLERRGAEPTGTVAAQPRQDALPDYFAFEARLRAPTEEVRERQRPYVELLAGAAPVLDVGCGRGELLGLLRDAGVEAKGVDADADMVAFARGEGLDVAHIDVLAHLGGLADGTLGAVTALQLVEHLPPPALVSLLELAARKLRPGGLLLLETINPASPRALQNYFADLTHAQPLVPETLELLVRGAGFEHVELRYLNPPGEKLRTVELPAGAEWDAARVALARNEQLLNEALFAPLDYAVIARRP